MSVKIIGTSSGVEIDSDTDKNLRSVVRPPAFGALGAYSKALLSGTIAAVAAANSVQWAMQWTDATRLCLVERIRVSAVNVIAMTAAQFNLELKFGSSFSVAPTTNIGTTATFSGRNGKRRTSMGASLMGGMWINGTSNAGLTGQTVTLDTDAVSAIEGSCPATVGAQMFPQTHVLWEVDNSNKHPLILAQNEGLLIRNPIAAPAAGTWQLAVCVDWMEVAAY